MQWPILRETDVMRSASLWTAILFICCACVGVYWWADSKTKVHVYTILYFQGKSKKNEKNEETKPEKKTKQKTKAKKTQKLSADETGNSLRKWALYYLC